MRKHLLAASLLSILLLVPAAIAAASTNPNAGLSFGYKASGGLRFIVYYVNVWSDTKGVSGPGGSVVITDCRAGQGLPLGPEPLAATASAGAVAANKLGDVQWNFDSVPPQAAKPYTLKLVYAAPKHSLPYSVCMKASALQNSSGIRLSQEMRLTLKATK